MTSNTQNTSPSPGRRRLWKRIVRALLWFFTILSCVGLITSSYSGAVDPSTFSLASIMLLSYPVWLVVAILAAVLDLLACRRALIALGLSVVVCLPAIWSYSPLNVLPPRVPEEARGRTFKFLTYNVAAFHNFSGKYPGDVNPTISYILNSGADVVNLQEVYIFATSESEHITPEQIDSLHKIYPYVLLNGYSQALLSKFPAENIRLDWVCEAGNEIAAFRLNIYGEPVTIFDVHLQSYGLTDADKSLFRSLTRLHVYDNDELREIKRRLLDKINAAAYRRADDVRGLGHYISSIGGPNVIVAGDFNDVPNCFTLRYLQDFGMHEVYPEVGFGPLITYNSSRFYFRIDHVLYRGALQPLSFSRSKVNCSDHYPVTVDFAVTGE